MDVSKNRGTPKSSNLIGFSLIFTIHFGVPVFLETPISETVMLGVVQDLGRKLGLVLAEHLRDVDLVPSKREVPVLHCCRKRGGFFSW